MGSCLGAVEVIWQQYLERELNGVKKNKSLEDAKRHRRAQPKILSSNLGYLGGGNSLDLGKSRWK